MLVTSVSALPTVSKVQVATIDYTAWSNLHCNAFFTSPVINGVTYRTYLGQPIKPSNGLSPLITLFDKQILNKGTANAPKFYF